jgi:hypothetical protein
MVLLAENFGRTCNKTFVIVSPSLFGEEVTLKSLVENLPRAARHELSSENSWVILLRQIRRLPENTSDTQRFNGHFQLGGEQVETNKCGRYLRKIY